MSTMTAPQISDYQKKVQEYLRQALVARGMDPAEAEQQASSGAAGAPKQSSGLGQMAGSALTVGTTLAARRYLANALADKGTPSTPNVLGVNRLGETLPETPTALSVERIGADGSVTHPDGTNIAADGTVKSPEGFGLTTEKAMEYLGYAASIYNAYRALTDKNLTSKQRNIALLQSGLTAGQAAMGGNPALSAASGALNIYGTLSDDNLTGKQQATRVQQQAALAAADYFTGGLASPIEGLLRQNSTTGKLLSKWDKFDQKYNPLTQAISGFMSSKDADQMGRDRYRDFLIEQGVISPDWQYTDPEGRKIDMGQDGGARLQNFAGANIDGETDRGTYDVDFTNPFAGKAVAYLNPLAALSLGTGEGKLHSDATGMLTNTALAHAKSEEDARKAALALYARHNIDSREKALERLGANKAGIGTNYDAYVGGIDELFSGPRVETVAPRSAPTQVVQPKPLASPRGRSLLPGISSDGRRIANA